ncbi:MAG: hypothetical protein N2V72_03540 [Methanophagales archaeon]|nr:hypothetical protein [Methanophagales archaeon]
MPLNEADTRVKLIEIINSKPRLRERGRADYLLRVRVNSSSNSLRLL